MSFLMQSLLILLLEIFACGKVTIQGEVCKKYLKSSRDSFFYNGIFFAAVMFFLAVIFRPTIYTGYTFMFGVVIGFSNVLFQCLYSLALSCGPVSLTVMITSFSIFISTISSVIIFKESVGIFQVVGIIFLVSSLILTTLDKSGGNGKKANGKWLALTLIAMVFCGLGSTLQNIYGKLFANTEAGDSSTSMLVVTYGAAAIFAFIIVLFMKRPTAPHEKFRFKKVLPYALAAGLSLCIYQRLTMIGLANIDGLIYFPVTSGLQSLLMTIIGIVRFKDKLSRQQWIGVGCGFVSVCLMNIR